MNVNKINLKKAQSIRESQKPYRPPQKSMIKSQFTEIFSYQDQLKECESLQRSLCLLNATKSNIALSQHDTNSRTINQIMHDELRNFERKQRDNQDKTITAQRMNDSHKFEKMLDYVQAFSKDGSHSQLPKRRPFSSYSQRTAQTGVKSFQNLTNQSKFR